MGGCTGAGFDRINLRYVGLIVCILLLTNILVFTNIYHFTILHFDLFFLVKETNCKMKEKLKGVLDLPKMSSFFSMNQKIPLFGAMLHSRRSRIKSLLYFSFHSSRNH